MIMVRARQIIAPFLKDETVFWPLMCAGNESLKMNTAQVVEKSVNTNNSLPGDYSHPDDHNQRTVHTPGFKPFV